VHGVFNVAPKIGLLSGFSKGDGVGRGGYFNIAIRQKTEDNRE